MSRIYPNARFALAAVTLSELLVGAFPANSPQRQRPRETFANTVIEAASLIPFAGIIARRYALTLAELGESGQIINPHDLMIAATALIEQAAVLTPDVRDFTRVPGLEIEIFDLSSLDYG